jgi:hypothetical protein
VPADPGDLDTRHGEHITLSLTRVQGERRRLPHLAPGAALARVRQESELRGFARDPKADRLPDFFDFLRLNIWGYPRANRIRLKLKK